MNATHPLIRLTVGTTVLEFSGQSVISASLVQQVNPISIELPISTLDCKVLSYDDSFSMFDGEMFQLLSERLPIMLYENVGLISNFLGKFYLDTWKNPSEHEFEFTAIDILGVMDATDFDGAFWGTPTTLEAILAQVLSPISIAYTLDDSIKDVEITGWIPPGNYRTALQHICFAAGAVAITAKSETLIIQAVQLPYHTYDERIESSGKTQSKVVELLPLVSSIELVSHNYVQSETLESIFSQYLEAGTHKIVFQKPYYSIVVDGPGYTPTLLTTEDGVGITTEDGDPIEVGGQYVFGPNALYLNMSSAGTVTVTGYPWIDNQKGYLFTETGTSAFAHKKALSISDATLISDSNAQVMLDEVRDYYRLRYTQNNKLFPSAVTVGDIVGIGTLHDKSLLANVVKMDMDLVGGYLAKTDILGLQPVWIPNMETPYRRARTGIAISGAGLDRNNGFRDYA